MKQQLTAEQSAKLISKGVRAERASEIEEYNGVIPQLRTHKRQSIFTLADLLEILPKEFNVDGNRYRLRMEICTFNSEWTAAYVDFDNDPIHGAMDEELIVCLYLVALWCADNNYLNKE